MHGFGPNSAGEAIVISTNVDALNFTGESKTGATIMRRAAEGVRLVSFELGGKNAAVVFADCDFDKAVEGVARSSFFSTGQVCLCSERVYVERPIFHKFVAVLAERALALRPGGDAAKLQGPQAGGFYVQPTIWTGLGQNARCMQEEVFGPVCHVMPFDDEEEAVALANDSRYGLAACLWTTNLTRAHRMAALIEVGTVWLNTWFLRDLRTPFGGAKLSGIGREGGKHSLDFYSEIRNVCLKL